MPGRRHDEEYEVDEAGIAYRLRPQALVPAVTLTTGPTPPGAWGEEQQAVYRFYQLVGLLHGLEGDDRRFIGVKLGEILSGIGVSQADDVLRMLAKEGDV